MSKYYILPFLLLPLLFVGATRSHSRPNKPETDIERYIRESTVDANLIILATSKNFSALKRQAQRISQKTHIPFQMDDRVYIPKRGLVVPDNDEFDGRLWRRYDFYTDTGKPYLSIEESASYPGLKKGYFLLIGGITYSRAETRQRLARYRHAAPHAYAHHTRLYMGCMS